MKNIEKILLLIGIVAMVSCSKPKADTIKLQYFRKSPELQMFMFY